VKAFDWNNLKFKIYQKSQNKIIGIGYVEHLKNLSDLVFLPYSGHNTFDGKEVYHGDIVTYKRRECDKWEWGRTVEVVLVE
jgi:hypothetical protein